VLHINVIIYKIVYVTKFIYYGNTDCYMDRSNHAVTYGTGFVYILKLKD